MNKKTRCSTYLSSRSSFPRKRESSLQNKIPAFAGMTRHGVGNGLTLIELLITIALGAIIITGLMWLMTSALDAYDNVHGDYKLQRQVNDAMHRIVTMTRNSPRLLLPLANNPATPQDESVHTALAFAMSTEIDRDNDGFADADNDRDGLVDEDIRQDMNRDGKPGIKGIDDDKDGSIDEGVTGDDDEDGTVNEDPFNLIDDDGDGMIDEDTGDDYNSDGAPGFLGIDDDNDASIDEGAIADDDEDGTPNEDWIDSIVYFQQGTTIVERMPLPHASNGTDYDENVIIEGVTQFQVTRLTTSGDGQVPVNIVIEVSDSAGNIASVDETVLLGERF